MRSHGVLGIRLSFFVSLAVLLLAPQMSRAWTAADEARADYRDYEHEQRRRAIEAGSIMSSEEEVRPIPIGNGLSVMFSYQSFERLSSPVAPESFLVISVVMNSPSMAGIELARIMDAANNTLTRHVLGSFNGTGLAKPIKLSDNQGWGIPPQVTSIQPELWAKRLRAFKAQVAQTFGVNACDAGLVINPESITISEPLKTN